MSGNFKVSHVNYTNALNNLEVYLKYDGSVKVVERKNGPAFVGVKKEENANAATSRFILLSKVWQVVRRAFVSLFFFWSKSAKPTDEVLAEFLTTINQTHRALNAVPTSESLTKVTKEHQKREDVEPVHDFRYGTVEESELSLCAIFYNCSTANMRKWNDSPELRGRLEVIELPTGFFDFIPFDYNGFSSELSAARESRFVENTKPWGEFFDKCKERPSFMQYAVLINTWNAFHQFRKGYDALICQSVSEYIAQFTKAFEKIEEVGLNQACQMVRMLKAYDFPDLLLKQIVEALTGFVHISSRIKSYKIVLPMYKQILGLCANNEELKTIVFMGAFNDISLRMQQMKSVDDILSMWTEFLAIGPTNSRDPLYAQMRNNMLDALGLAACMHRGQKKKIKAFAAKHLVHPQLDAKIIAHEMDHFSPEKLEAKIRAQITPEIIAEMQKQMTPENIAEMQKHMPPEIFAEMMQEIQAMQAGR